MFVNLKQALQSVQGFRALSDSVVQQLIPYASLRSMRAGETIFCQGEPSPYCFGILSGEVIIQHLSKDRRFAPKNLGIFGAGDLFGEASIFEESPRSAMASAMKEGQLVAVRGQPLRDWVQENPAASQPLLMVALKVMMTRLQKTSLELSVVYGIGRLLGSEEPFLDQCAAALEFLKGSLDGVTDLVLYQRSVDGEVFVPLRSFPALPDLPAIPVGHELVGKVEPPGIAKIFIPRIVQPMLETFQLPWKAHAAMAVVPLFHSEKSQDNPQGILVLASRHHPQALAVEKHLLFASLALPFAETLARCRYSEQVR